MSGSSRIKVRFHELDPNGHVNHGVYANYFETARIELLEAIGFGPGVLADRGVHLVVVELRIRYTRPARAGDSLTVRTSIAQLQRASSWWHQQLLDESGQVVAEAEVRSTATNAEGRPIRPPQDLAEALALLQA
ncbi:MAG TPA: acyl-CoA thioesterase [Egicoccus sp.]|nr:acyl-CoA thioesterase [Egicoccus sp.]HSK25139.1 acyl-CoA thioesterase [Egicoccus sp.]